jgi:hypothetical protein
VAASAIAAGTLACDFGSIARVIGLDLPGLGEHLLKLGIAG